MQAVKFKKVKATIFVQWGWSSKIGALANVSEAKAGY